MKNYDVTLVNLLDAPQHFLSDTIRAAVAAVLPEGKMTKLVLLENANSMDKHESTMLGELKEACQRQVRVLIGEFSHS